MGGWINLRGFEGCGHGFHEKVCGLQVLLINPNLVPQAVNVVIRDNLYELKFLVEINPTGSSPQLMETDHQHEDGGSEPRKEAGEYGRDKRLMLGHNSSSEAHAGGSSGQAGLVSQGVNKLLPTFHVHLPMEEGTGIAPAFGVPVVQESHSGEAMQNMHSGPMDVDECKLKDCTMIGGKQDKAMCWRLR
jgi:hypothetical protein